MIPNVGIGVLMASESFNQFFNMALDFGEYMKNRVSLPPLLTSGDILRNLVERFRVF